jgi:LPXTG-site transpeptidase (sortase) family protein
MGLESDGTLEVPSDAQEAGWFARGPKPGENGSAVIVGHYDSRTGPGIFWPLKKLRVGDEVGVVDRRGNEFVFEIVRIEQVDKDLFPTRSVYGPTAKPTLKLITCKGDIDPATGHYADNLIAYGKLAG